MLRAGVVAVEVLPFDQLFVEIDVTRVRQQLIERLLVGPMRPLHLAVELGRPGLDVDVPDAVVGQVPMKRGLALMATVSPHRMHPKRKLLDHVVEEVHGVLLGMARVDLQRSDACRVINGRVLIPLRRPPVFPDELQERDVNLHVMPRDLPGVPVRVHRSSPDATGESIQAVAPEDGRCCTNRDWSARCQPTGSSPADTIRHGTADLGHPIQDLTAEDNLTPLPRWTPGAKAIANDGRVAEARVLHLALTRVP